MPSTLCNQSRIPVRTIESTRLPMTIGSFFTSPRATRSIVSA
jgi:hypothetical protein